MVKYDTAIHIIHKQTLLVFVCSLQERILLCTGSLVCLPQELKHPNIVQLYDYLVSDVM